MQYSTLPVVSTLLLSAVKLCSAVNMSQYDPQTGVQPEFKAFLTAFVHRFSNSSFYRTHD